MKIIKTICTLFVFFAIVGCDKDEKETIPTGAFPDLLFEKYILQNFDTDKDGLISFSEARAIKEINCSDMRLTSLKGIQYFTELEKLDCSKNEIRDIDVTKNTSLKVFYCDYCDLGESIDISKNILLERFHCSYNHNLKTINLNNNTNLIELHIIYNDNLSSLDLSANKNLQILSCADNASLKSIDVSNNKGLKELFSNSEYYSGLIITGLDGHNLIEKLELIGVKAQTINIKGSPLKVFDCKVDDLASLNLSGCNKLESLKLDRYNSNHNNLSIDINNCSSLNLIEIQGYMPESIDVSSCISLKNLKCFTNVNISKNTELEEIDVHNIIGDIKSNKKLKKILCYSVKNVDIFDLSNQTLLEELFCYWIDIPLDISKCTLLKRLLLHYDIEDVKITNTTIKNMPNLEQIDYINKASLIIEDCSKLTKVGTTYITDLHISKCTILDFLSCTHGSLKEINIDQCPNITLLDCSINPITNLSLGEFTNLISLYCIDCSLTELDLRKNKMLDLLQCQGNPDLKYVYVTHTIPKLNHGGATMVYSDE